LIVRGNVARNLRRLGHLAALILNIASAIIAVDVLAPPVRARGGARRAAPSARNILLSGPAPSGGIAAARKARRARARLNAGKSGTVGLRRHGCAAQHVPATASATLDRRN
jgi:hypothetical protein